MVPSSRLQRLLLALLPALATAIPFGSFSTSQEHDIMPPSHHARAAALQDIVTFDNASLSIHDERIFLLSAEFHPFRLPSPGLWLDVFQKLKAAGYTAASFYVYWPVLEGNPGEFRADGVFALEQFFDAAKQAGVYLLARPGPYINSESSGGGLPGWLQRLPARLRSSDPVFLETNKLYVRSIAEIISRAQITNGGPVILFQSENEFSVCSRGEDCLDRAYQQWLNDVYRAAGIVVPIISNDVQPYGNFKPGSGLGEVDVYGWDTYPLTWGSGTCENPTNWNRGGLPQSELMKLVRGIDLPISPRMTTEFQGGFPDPWGGVGPDLCAALVGHEFERVFYKMNYAMHLTIMNLYMGVGGTNWGNIGHPLGYTSYDIGAAIREDRTVTREKYAEMKLQGNFHRASPAYLTARDLGEEFSSTDTDNADITISRVWGDKTKFYISRHTDHTSFANTEYTWRAETSLGEVRIPQLGGRLAINGRDSKIHVVDYQFGDTNLIYSSAEVFTWKKSSDSKTLLVLYGGEGEIHEFALSTSWGPAAFSNEGEGTKQEERGGMRVVQWTVQSTRNIARFEGGLDVHLLSRNDAYQHWVIDLPASEPRLLYTSPSRLTSTAMDSSVVIRGAYLIRSATITGNKLSLIGDVDRESEIEVISAPDDIDSLSFNGVDVQATTEDGRLHATISYEPPDLSLPDLSTSEWRYINSLPELEPAYDDSAWTNCNQTSSNNPRALTTPTTLYSGDYGYHAGSLLYRGRFTANGNEETFYVQTRGGRGFGHSLWLDGQFLGSVPGNGGQDQHDHTVAVPRLQAGDEHVITVLIDHMGYQMNFVADAEEMKTPRGIQDYGISGHNDKRDFTWKMTGNFGGEQYFDKSRGPLNEGSTFAERQGYHLPGAPTVEWEMQSPVQDGLATAGVGLFSTKFTLDVPEGYDVPLRIDLDGEPGSNFRAQIYVNGWQFGKYVNHIGPQKVFPVPEGIINHQGENTLAIVLWAQDEQGAKLRNVQLSYDLAVQSGYSKPAVVQASSYEQRDGSY